MSASQNSSSANRRRLRVSLGATSACQLRQLLDLALEPGELQRDDQDVGEHRREHDQVRRGHVLLGRGHASSSRSSRRRESSRFPASSTWYSVAASKRIAAHETQKVANIRPDICGPCDVNTVGWMKSFASRMARKMTGMRATPQSAYTDD